MLPPQAALAITATVVAVAAWLVRRPKRDPALARRAAAAMELLAVLGQHGATHVLAVPNFDPCRATQHIARRRMDPRSPGAPPDSPSTASRPAHAHLHS